MGQCTAKSVRSGERCRRAAIKGGTVCYIHGGAASQVKAKAAERIKEARDLALAKFMQSLGADAVDARTQLDASVKLTELTETLAGRVGKRVGIEHQFADLSDEDLIAIIKDTLRDAADG